MFPGEKLIQGNDGSFHFKSGLIYTAAEVAFFSKMTKDEKIVYHENKKQKQKEKTNLFTEIYGG